MSCSNNLKQISLALHNYHDVYKVFPPAGLYPRGVTGGSWSAHARLLPFLEQANLQNLIDWGLPYSAQPLVTKTRVDTYLCPSEIKDRERPDGVVTHYPMTYGINVGTWFIYDPNNGQYGNGLTDPNAQTNMASLTDGTSNTLAFAEVKAWTPYLRDGSNPSAAGTPIPSNPAAVAAFGGSFKPDSGHTEWVDGRVHQTGVSGTFPPNTVVPYVSGGVTYDVDFNSSREGRTTNELTYAVVTSRSYHPGGVNVALADGSSRFVAETVELLIWRAVSTRDGGEAAKLD
jgi:prepilin-type processing-associated H-X9-DG protein